jgi:hypothetical protein
MFSASSPAPRPQGHQCPSLPDEDTVASASGWRWLDAPQCRWQGRRAVVALVTLRKCRRLSPVQLQHKMAGGVVVVGGVALGEVVVAHPSALCRWKYKAPSLQFHGSGEV